MGFSYKSTWLLWREISWLEDLSKDRCMRRRCNYEMNASLAMHSRVHQDFLKETSILGMCIGERKEELTNGRKPWRQTVHGCTCTRYLSLSLSLPLSFVLFFLFYSYIISRVCYCSFFFLFYSFSAHPSSYIIALTLHSFFAFLLFHTFLDHSDRVPMHSTIN